MSTLEILLRQDRVVVLASLGGVVAIAWVYLLLGAGIQMDEMDMGGGQVMLMAPPWTLGYAALIFVMWSIMMMAMMLPSAAPTILLVSALARNRGIGHGVPTASLFALGYVLVWTGFSIAATLLQWSLDRAGWLSEAMAATSTMVAGSGPDRSGHLPVDTVEAELSEALPFAIGFPAATLAQGCVGRRDQWCSARHLLPRLLLDANADAVRWRVDEPALDWRACCRGLD